MRGMGRGAEWHISNMFEKYITERKNITRNKFQFDEGVKIYG